MAKKINIFNHVLVPKHEVLSDKEKKELLEKYNIKPIQLPKILVKDPCVKALKAKVGDVIKITRDNKSVYYRIVVSE